MNEWQRTQLTGTVFPDKVQIKKDEIKDHEKQLYFQKNILDPKLMDLKPNRVRRSPIMVEFVDYRTPVVDIARAIKVGMNIIKFRMAVTTADQRAVMKYNIERAEELSREKVRHPNVFLATSMAIKTFIKKTGILEPHKKDDDIHDVIIDDNAEIILTNDPKYMALCNANQIFIGYPNMTKEVKVGMEITLGIGDIRTHCTEIIDENSIKCKVWKGGKLEGLMTVYMRGLKHAPYKMSEVDENFLQFCINCEIDLLVIYYAQNGEMVQTIKRYLPKNKLKPLIFGGICDETSLNNFDEILKECDGIILYRDFLELQLEGSKMYRLLTIQKWVASKCRQVGKPLFVNGVLGSVITTGNFSDADVLDVSNTLLDGVTGFVFNHCIDIDNTLIAIKIMNSICCRTEPLSFEKRSFWRIMKELKLPVNAAEAAVISCVAMANQSTARVIIISTTTGSTAQLLLYLQPQSIIITDCSSARIARRMRTCRNIYPLVVESNPGKSWYNREEERVNLALTFAMKEHWLLYGDHYVTLRRSSDSVIYCDMVRLHTVTFVMKGRIECPEEKIRPAEEKESVPEETESIEQIEDIKGKASEVVVPGLLDDESTDSSVIEVKQEIDLIEVSDEEEDIQEQEKVSIPIEIIEEKSADLLPVTDYQFCNCNGMDEQY